MTSRRGEPLRAVARRELDPLRCGRRDRKGIFRLAFDSAIGAAVRRKRALARLLAAPVLLSLGFAPSSTESAIANGDTRTISFSNSHTNESGSFTYMVDGVYDLAVLEKLNWFLRDWRLNEPTKMDPKLFDIVWEVYRESGSTQPIDVLSGYRSPQTNAMLRRRSRQVAKYSQHMEGKAIDAHFVDVSTATIRDVAMRMQAGGVGFYPDGLDALGAYRQRLGPLLAADEPRRLGAAVPGRQDGVHSRRRPADARLRAGARRDRVARRRRVDRAPRRARLNSGLLSWLFGARGGGADDEEENGGSEASLRQGAPDERRAAPRSRARPRIRWPAAKRDLPRGATFMQPAPERAAASRRVGRFRTPQSDAGPVSLHGPIAAQFIAPLPPRKPADLAAMQLAEVGSADAAAAPRRIRVRASPAQGTDDESAANRDLIAALLAKGRVPGVITRGMARRRPAGRSSARGHDAGVRTARTAGDARPRRRALGAASPAAAGAGAHAQRGQIGAD